MNDYQTRLHQQIVGIVAQRDLQPEVRTLLFSLHLRAQFLYSWQYHPVKKWKGQYDSTMYMGVQHYNKTSVSSQVGNCEDVQK